jgi:hypothetical protein
MALLFSIIWNEAFSQKTKFGLTFGINSSKFYSDNIGIHYARIMNSGTGFTVGTFAKVSLNKSFTFLPTLSYVRKKSSQIDLISINRISGDEFEFTLNYLYRPSKKSKFSFGAGPSFSLGSYSEKIIWFGYPNPISLDYSGSKARLSLGCGMNTIAKYEFNQRFALVSNFNFDLQESFRNQYFGLNIQYSL